MARLLRRLAAGVAGGIAIRRRCGGTRRLSSPGWRSRWFETPWTRTTLRRPTATGPSSTASPGWRRRPGVVRVGLVATYANWKGHDVFLDALARLTRDRSRRFGVTLSAGRSMPPRGLSYSR